MFKVVHQGRTVSTDVGDFAYFVLSTGTFQTYARWRKDRCRTPLRTGGCRDGIGQHNQVVKLVAQDRA